MNLGTSGNMNDRVAVLRAASRVLLCLGVGLVLAGFLYTDIWSFLPDGLTEDIIRLSLYTAAAGVVLRFLYPLRYANALLLIWFSYHVAVVGVAPVLGTAVVAAAAIGLGGLLLPERIPCRLPLALIAGLAVIAGILGWLLPFSIHTRYGYLLTAFALCWWRRRAIARLTLDQIVAWNARVAAAPRLSAVALMALGLASTGAWVPTVQFDDLVYHMGLPTELRVNGSYRMDASTQVWALSPWAGDVVQAVAQVIAGEPARSSVDLLWWSTAVLLILDLNRRFGGTAQTGWLAVGSAGSLPLVFMLLGGMQGELPGIPIYAAAALIVLSAGRKPDSHRLTLLSACIALGFGLKVSNVLGLVPFGVWLLYRWRGKLFWREVPVALILAIVIAGSSYTYALVLTGNPILPLFNGWFQSEFFHPENFSDGRWAAPIGWDFLWQLTFATDQYCECYPGAAGFHWLALAGVLPVALARTRTRGVVICALTGAMFIVSQTHYLRYTFPMLVLLIPIFSSSLHRLASPRLLACILIALMTVNIAYASNSSWMLRAGVVKTAFRASEARERVLRSFAPERLVADYLEAHYGQEMRVLLADPSRPYTAVFAGRAFGTGWYDPEVTRVLYDRQEEPEAEQWADVFDRLGVSHVLVTDSWQNMGLQAALDAADAKRELRVGDVTLYRLEHGFSSARIVGESANVSTWADFQKAAGPTIIDVKASLACTPPNVASFDVRVYEDAGKISGHRTVSTPCPRSGSVLLETRLFTGAAPSRVELETPANVVQVIAAGVRLRKDAVKTRSLSARARIIR